MNNGSSDDFLRDSTRSGLYHLAGERHQDVAQAARRLGLVLVQADISACRTKAAILVELGRACQFPEWYGANLDALFDCLTDPDWQTVPVQVMLISGCGSLLQGSAEDFSPLLTVLAAAAEERRTAGYPLWVLIDAPVPSLTSLLDA